MIDIPPASSARGPAGGRRGEDVGRQVTPIGVTKKIFVTEWLDQIINSRLRLLILAVPLLAALAWLVTWQRPPITRLAFSPDGKFLAGSSDRLGPGAVRVWNLATEEEVLSIDDRSTASALAFSPDGELLAIAHQDGGIQFWSIATGQQRRAAAVAPAPVIAVAFSTNGKKLVYVSATGAVDQCDVATCEVAPLGEVESPGVVALSRDAKQLAVSGASHADTKVYEISPDAVTLGRSLRVSLTALAFSPDGELLAGVPGVNGPIYVWDLDAVQTIGSVGIASATEVNFLDRWTLGWAELGGRLQLFDWASGRNSQSFLGGGGEVSASALTDDGTIAAATNGDGRIHLWNRASALHRVLPSNFWMAVILATWLAAFTAWTVAWIRSGLRSTWTSTPLFDTAMIIAILITGLAARISLTGQPYEIGPPAVAFGLGLLLGILGLAIIFAVAGRARWQWRLPVLLVTWSFVCGVPLAVEQIRGYSDEQVWEVTVAGVAMFASLATALKLGQACSRRRGLCERQAGGAGGDDQPAWQFRLQDITVWTAAAGISFAVARHLSPRIQPSLVTAFEAVGGASVGITCAAAYWAAHGRHIVLRTVVLLAVAVAAGSATELFRASVPLHPWWWYVSIHLTAAVCIACSLFVVRRGS